MSKERKEREKNPAAVALGKLGGRARAAKYTPEESSALATTAIQTRWKDHEYADTPGARAQRKRRAKLKEEQEVQEQEARK